MDHGHGFNLLDAPMWEALRDTVEAMEREGLDYAIVGGTAAQVWIAALLTRRGELSLGDAVELPLRLRRTRDIDISTEAPADRMLLALNRWAATVRPPVAVLSPRAVRLRGIHVNFTLEPGDVSGFQEHYRRILERAEVVGLRRGAEELSCRVESLEDLIGTKLTRKGNQAKDLLDMDFLCASLMDASESVSRAAIAVYLDEPSTREALAVYADQYPGAFAR